jgi:hypothetical protein
MAALRVSIPTADLIRRLKERLRGDPPNASTRVVWQRDGDSVLVNTDSLTVRLLDGWLVCNLDLQTDQTGRQMLQFIFFLGKEGEGDSLQAASTINAPTPGAAQLAAAWGPDLQRVLWDAVLDAIELMVYHAESLKRGSPIIVGGFHCTPEAIVVDLLAGSR